MSETAETAFKTSALKRLSPPGVAAVHAYFDLCPESPDGSRLLFFRFHGAVPGSGEVVLTDRDGHHLVALGHVAHAGGHVGAFQQWLDDDHVAWTTSPPAGNCESSSVTLHQISTGKQRTFPGALRSLHPASRRVFSTTSPERAQLEHANRGTLSVLDLETGRDAILFTIDDLMPAMPDPVVAAGIREHLKLSHPIVSPDGSLLHFQISPDVPAWRRAGGAMPWANAEFRSRTDGTQLTYRGDKWEHAVWMPDSGALYGYEKTPPGSLIRGVTPAEWGDYRNYGAVFRPLEGTPRLLHTGNGVHGTFSPEGAHFVTDAWVSAVEENAPRNIEIYRFDANDFARRETLIAFQSHDGSHATGSHAHPVWSRDSKRLYLNADFAEKRPALYALDLG